MPKDNNPKIKQLPVGITAKQLELLQKELSQTVQPPTSQSSIYEYTPDVLQNLSGPEAIEAQAELAKINALTTDSKYIDATSLLPGIYGYVEDANNDNQRVVLSLTPYEIAPRLSDFRFFTTDKKYSGGLQTAMTVGKRLQASRVFTNYMQEVLPSKGKGENDLIDTRFGSKDGRIGLLSRFLDPNGDETDKSTFLHIVPDVDATGGKVEIQYRRIGEDGNYTTENGTAYIPVNFNFTSSKYSLTIKEFIIENVSEASREIYSLNKSFDGYTLRMFGQQPQIISFNGILTNFDDDIIGLGDQILNPEGFEAGASGFTAATKGSQRDAFLSYYNNFLAGTKCRDYSMKLYFYYNHRIIEGYLIEMSMSSSSGNDNLVQFGGNIIVRKQYTTFEAGTGLGSGSSLALRNRNRGVFGGDIAKGNGGDGFQIFNEERSYRTNYREFALLESKNERENFSNTNRKNTKTSEGTIPTVSDKGDWINDPIQFDINKDSDRDKFLGFVMTIFSAMNLLTNSTPINMDDSADQLPRRKVVMKFIMDNPNILFNDFIIWMSNASVGHDFYLYNPNYTTDSEFVWSKIIEQYETNAGEKYTTLGIITNFLYSKVIDIFYAAFNWYFCQGSNR